MRRRIAEFPTERHDLAELIAARERQLAEMKAQYAALPNLLAEAEMLLTGLTAQCDRLHAKVAGLSHVDQLRDKKRELERRAHVLEAEIMRDERRALER